MRKKVHKMVLVVLKIVFSNTSGTTDYSDKIRMTKVPFTLTEKRFKWQTNIAMESCEITGKNHVRVASATNFPYNPTNNKQKNLFSTK